MSPLDERADDLEQYWDELGVSPNEPLRLGGLRTNAGDLVIGTPSNWLVRISATGDLAYGPNYTPEEAAQIFWTAMALQRAGMTERLMHFDIMEQLVRRVGIADLRTERLRRRAQQEGATPEDHFQADRSMAYLEALVHQFIEYARGIAQTQRPEALSPASPPPPAVSPEEVQERYERRLNEPVEPLANHEMATEYHPDENPPDEEPS